MNIIIGDAQFKVRFGLRLLLEQQPGWRVSGEAEEAQTLLENVLAGRPDLVLLDWELPGMEAEELLTVLRQSCPDLRVISISGKDELRQAALLAGADLFAYKADSPEKLLGMIRGIESGIASGLRNRPSQ